MAIEIKSEAELEIMHEAGQILAAVLDVVMAAVQPGVREVDIDTLCRDQFKEHDVIPTFLGYQDYPATVCISVNDKIVHGIPTRRAFKEGDIVGIDLGCTHRGFVADSARTGGVGRITNKAQRLIDTTRLALDAGIEQVRPGNRLGDVGAAIQRVADAGGYGVVREYVGHGVGRRMHEDPQVPNFGEPGKGIKLRRGMVLALEPMLNMGAWRTRRDPDGWSVFTEDGSLSAHFEHTVAVTETGPVVLTAAGSRLRNSGPTPDPDRRDRELAHRLSVASN